MSSKSSPSTVTSTGSTSPWDKQQPYLEGIFSAAQNLYNAPAPEYYQGATYATPTTAQNNAIAATEQLGASDPTVSPAVEAANNLLNGTYLADNPAYGDFQRLTEQPNAGTSSYGFNPLYQQATGNLGYGNPIFGSASSDIANQVRNPFYNAAGTSALSSIAGANPSNGAAGASTLSSIASTSPSSNPGNSAFQPYASGQMLGAAANPYTSPLAQSVLSQVVPGIQSQFIQGGMLNSPEAAYATSQGATAALAPVLQQQYQQEEQNQLQAGGALSNAYLQGLGLQSGAASNLLSGSLEGSGLQSAAANNLLQGFLGGNQQQLSAALGEGQFGLGASNLQQSAASDLANQYLQGAGLETTNTTGLQNSYSSGIQQMLGALALQPQTQGLAYNALGNEYAAGATDQSLQQQAINDAVQRWNYGQMLPYNQLNEYIGQITGNYGGTTSLTQPFLGATGSNLLGGALGGASLGSSLSGALGLSSGTGALGGAGLGALLGLI